MASFIYLYSKFTEEFLLLTAAGSFALLSLYCYTWVVKTRRLGAARNQVPAGMVKIYLNQLINEAQFVRTQLFGLVGGSAPDPEGLSARFQASPSSEAGVPGFSDLAGSTAHSASGANTQIPNDLWDRLKALERQLSEKESMVVNINIEKTKLLEELENVKQDQKTLSPPASPGNQDDLVQKIKALEERLEEYALFEDDLANLKRLQQENTQLKKRVEEAAAYEQKPKGTAGPAIPAGNQAANAKQEPQVLPSDSAARKLNAAADNDQLLDAAAVEALLEGTSATPPTPAEPEPKRSQELEINPAQTFAAPTPIQSAKSSKPAIPSDEFENLVDSVEGSLAKDIQPATAAAVPASKAAESVAAPATAAPATAPLAAAAPTPAAPSEEIGMTEKSDEELLKEFENLLNS